MKFESHLTIMCSLLKGNLDWTDVIDFVETQKRQADLQKIDHQLDKGILYSLIFDCYIKQKSHLYRLWKSGTS